MQLDVRQVTFGPKHHFFGYIGHCRTIPWSGDGRYIVCLQADFQDRMPGGEDAAGVVLLDTRDDFAPIRIEESRGWNPQQGTMFYWNPVRPERELFFNDRDRQTGEVFTVLYDIAQRRRVREYRFPGSAVANAGVAQKGGAFAAINYGRLARLRPVTGYPESADWTRGVGVPEDDGVFIVEIQTGQRRLICSYRRIVDHLQTLGLATPGDDIQMFINHTLWNREDDRILFYARSGAMWAGDAKKQLNAPFTIRPDGSELTFLSDFVGGHPEWDAGSRLVAEGRDGLRIYDACQQRYVDVIGNGTLFSDPKGDKALSPDASWLVHANCIRTDEGQSHKYVLYRRSDGLALVSPNFSRGTYIDGPLRLDPAPCWNRDGTQVLLPAISDDGTRQLFVISVVG